MLQEAPQCGWVNMPWMWETGPDHLGCVFRCTCISFKLIKVVLELSSTSKKCTALNNCQSCIKKKELFLVQWRKVLQKKLFSKFRVSFQLFILVKLSRWVVLIWIFMHFLITDLQTLVICYSWKIITCRKKKKNYYIYFIKIQQICSFLFPLIASNQLPNCCC